MLCCRLIVLRVKDHSRLIWELLQRLSESCRALAPVMYAPFTKAVLAENKNAIVGNSYTQDCEWI